MHFSTSDGKQWDVPEMCAHCQLNTGGEHEKDCPLFNPIVTRGNIFGRVNIHYEVLPDLSINFKKGNETI